MARKQRRWRARGITVLELMIASTLFSIFLVVSARVATSYYRAYKAIDASLPFKRNLLHQFEFLIRHLSSVEFICIPNSGQLVAGYRPDWTSETSPPVRLMRRDDKGRLIQLDIGSSKPHGGLYLVEHDFSPQALKQSPEPETTLLSGIRSALFQSQRVGRSTLLAVMVESQDTRQMPLRTKIMLRDLRFQTIESK